MSFEQLIQFIQTVDDSLIHYVDLYGKTIYLLLFLIVFAKTAFIVLIFLPGDTMVFASGALAAMSDLDLLVLTPLFIFAGFLGDQSNFLIGKTFGLTRKKSKLLQKLLPQTMLDKSQNYLTSYGKTAIMFARFIPILRGTLPFTCATTNYPYRKFVVYNFIGCVLWTAAWLFGGFLLGNIPFVQNNLVLTLFILSIVFILPAFINFFKKAKQVDTAEK